MRAIILSAGQGRRLLPLTRDVPKCLLEVHGPDTLLDVQLRTLAACGVHHASVMVGFGADRIEDHLARHPVAGIEVRTRYNPFYSISDNLVTAWLSRSEMKGDFLYLNGDTLFDPRILEHLVQSAHEPITLAVNRKRSYDDDDMRVALRPRSGGTRRLEAVGKRLPDADVDGESIGLMLFRGGGGRAFHDALEWAVREPGALKLWYLSVIDALAGVAPVDTVDITGLWWGEVDSPADLASIRQALARGASGRSGQAPALHPNE